MFIDTHCHLNIKDYPDRDKLIKELGTNIVIVSGASMTDNKEVLELINKYDNIFGTIGIHPEELKDYNEDNLKWIEDNLANPKIVGLGEIGLDYKNGDINHELQKEAFITQIDLAKKYHKTIVVHSRDAAQDTLDILKEHLGNNKAVLHCYNYSYELAKEFIKMPIMFGIGGVLTFKNAKKLVEVVKNIDINYLLLETDSPYLTPEPYRGTRNEPKNVLLVAKKISEIKDLEYEKIVDLTTKNAISQFDLSI